MIREFKPKDIDLDNRLLCSDFRKSEVETIASNIILMRGKTNDWRGFTWLEYKKFCTHEISNRELDFIERMAKDGWLDKMGDIYSVNHKFLGCIEKFLIKPTK